MLYDSISNTGIYPDEGEFIKLAQTYRVVPVWCDIPADMETPISLYLKLRNSPTFQGMDGRPLPSFLLESVEGGERLARYSFIGIAPRAVIASKGNAITIEAAEHTGALDDLLDGLKDAANPLQFLRGLLSIYPAAPVRGLPRFHGGLVGYLGYDIVRFIETLPGGPEDDANLPDMLLMLSDMVIALDHVTSTARVIVLAIAAGGDCCKGGMSGPVPGERVPGGTAKLHAAYTLARSRIQQVLSILRGPGGSQGAGVVGETGMRYAGDDKDDVIETNIDRDEFVHAVKKAKEHIACGDIFQVVLSQRLKTRLNVDPFSVYRTLRRLNPSPYLYFLDFGRVKLVGSSPELLVRVEDRIVETNPIAGTRPRGRTPEEDARLERELLADEKERAEHVMLVDLGRNDIGKVARPGTVKVADFMRVERYSHVMHLVSTVRGTLDDGKTALDAFEACFPAGTLTGAPKVRAMEIIDDLEPTRRGPYGGAVGYLGLSGNMDLCIGIRTIIIDGDVAYVQSGAGIVADSDPAREYEESLNKAKALIVAIRAAEESMQREEA
ncbi:MAG TPA: anthranilate synthase component I [Firmicutes bacterium]|nr:anthranilate synthase component I [Bacillota bacterium]